MTDSFCYESFKREKEEWINLYGSESLQRGLIAGYPVNNGYKKERLELEYPGFRYVCERHHRVDTPTLQMLNACLMYEGSYCTVSEGSSFITIDNYLGDSLIVKEITASSFNKTVENSSGSAIDSLMVVFAGAAIFVATISLQSWFNSRVLLPEFKTYVFPTILKINTPLSTPPNIPLIK